MGDESPTQAKLVSQAIHINAKHEVVLQTLDRNIGGVKFRVDDFKATSKDWSKVPLIFVPKGYGHPNLDAWDKDYAEELKRINGRIINGKLNSPEVAIAGHPRLIAIGDIRDDDIDRMIEQGKLSLSTGFRAPVKDNETAGPVEPHHVLLFEETDHDQPKDAGSGFLNKMESVDMSDDAELKDALNGLDRLKAFLTGKGQESKEKEMSNEKELEAKLVLANKELDDAKTAASSKDARIKELEGALDMVNKKLDAMSKAIAEFEASKKNAEWEAVKNKLPKGMVHKDKEAETRKEFEESPSSLMMKVLEFKQKTAQEAEGDENASSSSASAKVGHYNAEKKVWEE